MKDRASKVVGEFKRLSKYEKKVVLQKILEDSRNQADAMDVVADNLHKQIRLQQARNTN